MAKNKVDYASGEFVLSQLLGTKEEKEKKKKKNAI